MHETASSELTGTVERITFFNPENGFSVVQLRVRGKARTVPVVGTLPAVQPGEVLVLSGQWRTDARHGAQFQPIAAEVARPSDVEGIIRYLGSGLIRQIGPVLAKRIVAQFGTGTLDVLDATPGRVREVPGIGPQRAEAIARAWIEHRALRSIVTFLTENSIDPRFAPRLLRAFGPEAPRILAANPYRLVAEVPGLGFAPADRLGRNIGVRPSSPARLQAAVQAALLRAGEDGHTRMSYEDLVRVSVTLAGADRPLMEAAIRQQLARGSIAYGKANGTASAIVDVAPVPALPQGMADGRVRVYEPAAVVEMSPTGPGLGLTRLVEIEEDIAARVAGMSRRKGLAAGVIETTLDMDAAAVALSSEQRAAVCLAAASGLFVLTGGPGVGKTTTTRALVQLFRNLKKSVALAAPTGKAAKRLGDVVGVPAKTLHRLLGSDPRGFRHGPREPLPFDVVIVDECSMLDTVLARALFRAIGPSGQLILVGDADQLPSVGPGQVLRDLLAGDLVPTTALMTVFRQAAQSRIVTNAHRIRGGLLPELEGPSALARGVDFVFVPASPDTVAKVGAEWAARLLPRALGVATADIQVLAPLTRVCQALNSSLQERLNPAAAGKPERPHGALPLRLGDRVIQTRNNYDLAVFNGDTGTLIGIEGPDLLVDFGDERTARYDAEAALDLDHAYCLTVHRAQGSEWPGVVVLASSSYGPMLSRNLLYTAVTRARTGVVIVGDQEAIRRAVAETRDQQRCTGLAALLGSGEGGLYGRT